MISQATRGVSLILHMLTPAPLPERYCAPPNSAAKRSCSARRKSLGAIFLSMELSRTTWLLTSLSPGGGERMSKHAVRSGDVAGLRARFSQLRDKVRLRTGQVVPIIVMQEAGLDVFWIHRLLQDKRIESYVVDPASRRCPAGADERRLTRSTGILGARAAGV
jgi:hypothetical protein